MAEGQDIPGVYEIFVQWQAGQPYEHAGSVIADSGDLALVLARENIGRRRNPAGIWACPRSALFRTDPAEGDRLFRLPKPYRDVTGYRDLAGRWRRYGREPITPDTMI
jgi:phenylacetate-CoA oxygenase PaaH subunit